MSKQNNTQEFPSYINSLKGFIDHEEGKCLNKYATKSFLLITILTFWSYFCKYFVNSEGNWLVSYINALIIMLSVSSYGNKNY